MDIRELADDELLNFLKAQGFVPQDLSLNPEGAKEVPQGNMNYSRFLSCRPFSLFVKQAFPYVAKFPDIAAPQDRLAVEAQFYRSCGEREFLPKFLAYCPSTKLLILTAINSARTLEVEADYFDQDFLEKLLAVSDALSSVSLDESVREILSNREMRKLNHEHIFLLPFCSEFIGSEFPEVASFLSTQEGELLQSRAQALGQMYLESEACLQHGDFYPGSFLVADSSSLFLIDHEFCFLGLSVFDKSVILAHLLMAGVNSDLIETALERFCSQFQEIELRTLLGLSGCELLRRRFGVARLSSVIPETVTIKLAGELLLRPEAFIQEKSIRSEC